MNAPTADQHGIALLEVFFENVVVHARYPHLNYVPRVDLEALLGEAWFKQMDETFLCDSRALLRAAGLDLLSELGKAMARLLIPHDPRTEMLAMAAGQRKVEPRREEPRPRAPGQPG